MINVDRALRSSIRTGKVVLGSNRTVETGLGGQAKLIVFAVDCPADVRMQLETMDVPVYGYQGYRQGPRICLRETLLRGRLGHHRAR